MNIGAQLYTVREFTQTEQGFADTIKKISEIGYKGIQISAAVDLPAERFREICDSYGVEITATHTAPDRIINDTQKVIEEHRIMGAGYIGIGGLPGKYQSAEGIKEFIREFTPAAMEIKKAGMRFSYHNHDFEFAKIDGKLMLAHLADGFGDEMFFTLDTFWVQAGGGDPAQWLEKLSGRVGIIHFKDMVIYGRERRMCEVLNGNLNWARIFAACEPAGVRWAFVEQDDCYGADPFECLRLSYENIKEAIQI